jgi:hypothetical protein
LLRTKENNMEKVKLDNGLLLIAYLSNILTPLGVMVYFGIKYLMEPSDPDSLFIMLPLGMFTVISLFMFVRFKKVEFDDQYVYVKNVFNSEIDSFPIRNIKNIKQMMFTFKGKNSRGRSGKNYAITYINNDGGEKKVRVMATIDSVTTGKFKKLTSFLGADGFNPE